MCRIRIASADTGVSSAHNSKEQVLSWKNYCLKKQTTFILNFPLLWLEGLYYLVSVPKLMPDVTKVYSVS